jgi:hypothetical protein
LHRGFRTGASASGYQEDRKRALKGRRVYCRAFIKRF